MTKDKEKKERESEVAVTEGSSGGDETPARRARFGLPEWVGEFDTMFGPSRVGEMFARFPDLFEGRAMPAMRIEEYTEGDSFVVRAEMPGVDPGSDVEVTVENGRLRIRAERRERSEVGDDDRRRSEFRYGAFERVVSLPPGVTTDDVTATYSDGILEVRSPVDGERREAHRVPIERGG